MKKGLVLIAFSLTGLATAYSQVKLQFVEVQMGQSVMSQGAGYSLFNKVVGDNLALSESIHLGWGKGPSRSTGAYVEMNTISMPNYDEIAAAFTMGLEMRRYIEINSSLRCHSGCSIGGIYVVNGYTMANEKKHESRFGLSMICSTGIEMTFGEHLYVGGCLSLSTNALLLSSFKPTDALPDKGNDCLWGSKLMITAGYRL